MESYIKLMIMAMVLGFLSIATKPVVVNGETTFCRMTKDSLKSCLPAVTASNPEAPTEACCSALSAADLQCFCMFKNSRVLDLYGIDFNQAIQLPVKCHLAKTAHC